jgi:hypothetical protein
MPVGVGDHDLAWRGLSHSRGNQSQHSSRVRARESHARAPARTMLVVVGKTGDDGLPAEIDDSRPGSRQPQDLSARADRGESSVRDRCRFRGRKGRVHRIDLRVHENQFGRGCLRFEGTLQNRYGRERGSTRGLRGASDHT